MQKIIALLIAVSKYDDPSVSDLPFCINDLSIMVKAIEKGIKVKGEDIYKCGVKERVTEKDFLQQLAVLSNVSSPEDTLIFYFSGHGASFGDEHFLCFSDRMCSTQDIVKHLDKINTRTKLIFLDCCYAGKFKIDTNIAIHIEESIREFIGKGFAVLAACNDSQYSYKHPDYDVSLFTYFLASAIEDKLIIKQGKKSLFDIQRLANFYIDVWNKKNYQKRQSPIYRANLGGTVYFEVEEFSPYRPKTIFFECEEYIICKVEPIHNLSSKRYCVKAISKTTLFVESIARIAQDLIRRLLYSDIYNNGAFEDIHKGKPTNMFSIHIGCDGEDVERGIYAHRVIWVDQSLDRNHWYNVSDAIIVDDLCIQVNTSYEFIKKFTEDNLGTKEEVVEKTKKLISDIIINAESLITKFQEFLNGSISESELIDNITYENENINRLFLISGDLPIAPIVLKKWADTCDALFNTINDMALFYGSDHFLKTRTPENRRACMELSIRQYYSTLERVAALEKELGLC